MRKIVVYAQTTLNGCIANEQGTFWEPFPWGDPEQAYVNEVFRAADTIVLSRMTYQAIVPWWEVVDSGRLPDDIDEVSPPVREFADILAGLRKVVISRTWAATVDRPVITGDLVAGLQQLKAANGTADILLFAGPGTLGPLISASGVVDEYVISVHPAVLASGPRLFEDVTVDLALDLVETTTFAAGVVILRYGATTP